MTLHEFNHSARTRQVHFWCCLLTEEVPLSPIKTCPKRELNF